MRRFFYCPSISVCVRCYQQSCDNGFFFSSAIKTLSVSAPATLQLLDVQFPSCSHSRMFFRYETINHKKLVSADHNIVAKCSPDYKGVILCYLFRKPRILWHCNDSFCVWRRYVKYTIEFRLVQAFCKEELMRDTSRILVIKEGVENLKKNLWAWVYSSSAVCPCLANYTKRADDIYQQRPE